MQDTDILHNSNTHEIKNKKVFKQTNYQNIMKRDGGCSLQDSYSLHSFFTTIKYSILREHLIGMQGVLFYD